jgi:hypothetical protein
LIVEGLLSVALAFITEGSFPPFTPSPLSRFGLGTGRNACPTKSRTLVHGMNTFAARNIKFSWEINGHAGCPYSSQRREIKMKKALSGATIALALVFGIIATTSTADAQWRRGNYGYGNQQQEQGYQYGVSTGAADAQRGQNYDPQRSRYYRDASSQAFRDAFVRGYDQGFRQYAENGGYGNGGYRNRNDGYNGRNNDGSYGRNDGYYGNGDYNNRELNSGYQQGINTGATDARSGKTYSPERSRYYRNASQAFREGFVRGYEQGYRQYARGNYRRNSSAADILNQIFRNP